MSSLQPATDSRLCALLLQYKSDPIVGNAPIGRES